MSILKHIEILIEESKIYQNSIKKKHEIIKEVTDT